MLMYFDQKILEIHSKECLLRTQFYRSYKPIEEYYCSGEMPWCLRYIDDILKSGWGEMLQDRRDLEDLTTKCNI